MPETTSSQLVRLALSLDNFSALEDTARCLRAGRLTKRGSAATIGAVASGRTGVATTVRELLNLWDSSYRFLNAESLAALLEAVAGAARVEREASPTTEVVWTGPKVEGSYLRSTRQVVRDLILDAKRELLVVGYWIAGNGHQEGIIKDVVELIAEATRRDVDVTMVLDRGEKLYGKNNRDVVLDLWPAGVAAPLIYTWDIPETDKHLKLHAKVLVADRSDALVTSANLTMYALDRNMEMGVRVTGNAGARIAHHFDLLRSTNVLVRYC